MTNIQTLVVQVGELQADRSARAKQGTSGCALASHPDQFIPLTSCRGGERRAETTMGSRSHALGRLDKVIE